MSLESPLARVLGSGSAKDGTGHWWSQRVSAVALALLGVWFVYSMTQLGSFDFATVSNWIAEPVSAVALVLLSLTLGWHSSLGVQVVIEDYVHAPGLKVVSLLFSKFAHAFVAIAAVVAVLRIALGANA